MSRHPALAAALTCVVFCGTSSAQDAAKVDFGRDVQPLLQTALRRLPRAGDPPGGFRLDRRADAMRGGTLSPGVIRPGNGDASPLYFRISGSLFGPQMPPAGALGADQIATIKRWIDEGAEWPDALSGETGPTPPDPAASRLMDALRRGDRQAFRTQASANPKVAKLKGPGGATPLMYAALYGDADAMRLLLAGGADPNSRNEAGATALMWAVDDREKTRLLLEHGADANARSDDGRTPLMIAAGRSGNVEVVRLLLDHGASASTRATSAFGETNAARRSRHRRGRSDAAAADRARRGSGGRGVLPARHGAAIAVRRVRGSAARLDAGAAPDAGDGACGAAVRRRDGDHPIADARRGRQRQGPAGEDDADARGGGRRAADRRGPDPARARRRCEREEPERRNGARLCEAAREHEDCRSAARGRGGRHAVIARRRPPRA